MPCSKTRAAHFGHGADGLLSAEVGRCLALAGRLPEVELEAQVVGEAHHRAEGLAHAAAKTAERADDTLGDQLGHLLRRPFAARSDLPQREVALLALELAVVLLHHAAALRAGHAYRGVHHVRYLALLDHRNHLAHELGDLLHELVALQLAGLDQLQLVFPLSGKLGRGELDQMQHVQREEQRKGLRRRHQLATVPSDVFLADQAFDDGGARRRRPEPLRLHRGAQLVVLDQLARALHRREQRRFRVARRRLGLVRLLAHLEHRHFLVLARSAADSARLRRRRGRRPQASQDFAERGPPS